MSHRSKHHTKILKMALLEEHAGKASRDEFVMEIPHFRIPETTTTEITLKIGPLVFTVESRTSSMTQLIYRNFSEWLGEPEASSIRVICDSKGRNAQEGLSSLSSAPIERRSNYWVLRTGGVEATYFPRYRMAYVATTEDMRHLLKTFQMLLTLWLDKEDGMLVQGMTVFHEGRSYLFLEDAKSPTPSGGLSRHARVLTNEDVSLVYRNEQGDYCAQVTPFGGIRTETHDTPGAPLAGLYFLTEERSESEINTAEIRTLPALLANLLWHSNDAAGFEALKDRAQNLLKSVPAYAFPSISNAPYWDRESQRLPLSPLPVK